LYAECSELPAGGVTDDPSGSSIEKEGTEEKS
jgi:hypothetical protein